MEHLSEAIATRTQLRKHRPAELHTGQLLVLSFALVILLATALLSLPAASRTGIPLRPVDAFFTAVSATCVTGLTVVDTSSAFTPLGQAVILLCIQIGGLGLMTLTTVFSLALGKRLAIGDRITIQQSFHHSPTKDLGSLILLVVLGTILTEAIGAIALAAWWRHTRLATSWSEALILGVFHSVSAFCNAGFALFPDSAMRFQQDPIVLAILAALIVAGGLGFLVSWDVKEYLRMAWRRRHWTPSPGREDFIPPRPRLSLHTKLVLTVTAALLLIGAISYWVLERHGVLAGMPLWAQWTNAWFCSITARTAGFNSVDYARMSGPTLLCTMVLMLIGASPGSTGGGVKTSTCGILVAYALFRWRGHEAPHIFGRTIPRDTVDRAAAVVTVAVAVIVLGCSLLMTTETAGQTADASQRLFLPVLFETFSAFGTVGLSMGITPQLTTTGKLALAALMFIGRVGPMTVAFAVATRTSQPRFRYADENVMVG